jgi:hypothetical protein
MRDHGAMRKIEDTDPFESAEFDLGPRSLGQSGDLQGLDSEEVAELLEEGQSFDAGIVSGIEDAPLPDEGDIKTREVSEDDVPLEYLGEEQGERP